MYVCMCVFSNEILTQQLQICLLLLLPYMNNLCINNLAELSNACTQRT